MQSNNVPVLLITYNRLNYTKKSLPALIQNTPGSRIVVIDNGSTDGTVEYLNGFLKDSFDLILNKDNMGLGHAMNQFFDITKGSELVAKVDNDTIVPPMWLDDMVSALRVSGFDVLQASHYFISAKFKGWADLVDSSEVIPVENGNVITSPTVGGTAIVIKRNIINEALPENLGLWPWGGWQAVHPGLKKGFFDGVWVDLLDMDGCNKYKTDIDDEYYRSTRDRKWMDTANIKLDSKISIIIPVIRPEKVERCKEAAVKNAGVDHGLIEIVAEIDVDGIGAPKMVKRLVDKSSHDLVMFLGDDTIPQPDYLKNALAVMETLPDGWGMVGLNDQHHDGNKLATHWLADKRLLPLLDGEFFHTGYIHCFCDNELMDRVKALGRYAWAKDAVIEHDHPIFNPETKVDAGYKKAYDRDNYHKDWRLYVKRKIDRNGFKLAIGLPIAGRMQVNDFWVSFILAEKPDYILLIPRMEIYEFPADIAAIRNDLVKQALEHGCTHLLMMDTDQVYPQDAIIRLLAHDKDVVGALVHRRYPPFAPIMYRGKQGDYQYAPDEEMYSGELVEVDATGTGCILYKTSVFLDYDYPWFVIGRDPKTGKTIGEDIGLCSRLRESGYHIYVDTAVCVDHLSTFRVNQSTYKLFKQFNTKGGHEKCQAEARVEKIVR